MKHSIKTIILWIFVILLSVSLFVYFGDTSSSFTSPAQVLGTVNGHPIANKRISEFSENYRSIQQLYEAQGLDINEYQQAMMGEAFRRAVVNYLVNEEAKDAKIVVSDSEVVDLIKNDYFEGDLEEFREFTESGDVTVQRDLEDLTRKRMVKGYYEDVFRGVSFTKPQLEDRVQVSSRQRLALVAIMNLANQLESSLTPEVLQAYYQDNISRYPNSSFEQVSNDVRSDYLLENRENTIANIESTVAFQFQNFRSNQINEQTFRTLAGVNNMLVFESEYFNFFSPAVTIKGSQGRAIINDRASIRKLFFIPVQTVSEIISQDNTLAVVYIIEEIVDDNASDFVKRRYEEELRQEVLGQIFNAYYSTLYNRSDIQINQQNSQAQ